MKTVITALLAASLSAVLAPAASDYYVYIGTYTNTNHSKGIYAYRFHPDDGKLTKIGLVAETPDPSFLAISPNGQFLYSVSEMEGKPSGGVSSFRIDPQTAKLTPLNTVSSKGSGPCHVLVDKTGKCVLVANYGSGSVAAFPVKDDGSLGEATAFIQHSGSSVDKERQEGPHAHSVNLPADNRFMLAADLGLDEVLIYKFDAAKGSLTPNDPPYGKVKPGSGPRHFAFHPDGKYAYAISEMASTVTAFHWDGKRGALTEFQSVSTLPADFKGKSSTAEIAIDKKGKFLYGSNRGHDSIAVFSIARDGKLTPVEQTLTQGKTPRNFALDPTGAYLFAANQDSNNIVLFHVDPKTGRLTPAGQTMDVGAPVCVVFAPAK
jgi:6-phosphogluconolactonase